MGESENNSQINNEEILENDVDEIVEDEIDREHDLKSLFEAVFFLSNDPVPIRKKKKKQVNYGRIRKQQPD